MKKCDDCVYRCDEMTRAHDDRIRAEANRRWFMIWLITIFIAICVIGLLIDSGRPEGPADTNRSIEEQHPEKTTPGKNDTRLPPAEWENERP